jgi:diacylglycerol kinase family enzyme
MVGGGSDDPNIRRYLAAKVQIKTNPPMSVTADSCSLIEGSVTVSIRRRALTVMAGELSF